MDTLLTCVGWAGDNCIYISICRVVLQHNFVPKGCNFCDHMSDYWKKVIDRELILFCTSYQSFSFSWVTGGISMKLSANIHHVSGRCWKGLQGQRSKFKVVVRQDSLFNQRDSRQLRLACLNLFLFCLIDCFFSMSSFACGTPQRDYRYYYCYCYWFSLIML